LRRQSHTGTGDCGRRARFGDVGRRLVVDGRESDAGRGEQLEQGQTPTTAKASRGEPGVVN